MSTTTWYHQLLLSVLSFSILFQQASALTVKYCSDLNTATTSRNSSIYQSNGLCHDFCLSSYAFAILQDDACWCSNYAPASTTTGCTTTCPGYPDDLCGGDGLYGYIQLTVSPSGTQGAGTGATTKSSSAGQMTVTATPQAVTVFETTTHDSTQVSTKSSASSTSAAATNSKSTSSAPNTETPTLSYSTVTSTGQVQTITYTPSSVPTSGTTLPTTKDTSKGGGLSTGAAVGLTVGLVALVAIISSIVYFCLRKRRQEKAEEYDNMDRRGSTAGLGSADGAVPSRNMSQNSKFVLGTDGRTVVRGWESADGDVPSSGRGLQPIDPRLDPFAGLHQNNKSRDSVNTIHDEHDYSRRVAHGVLRAVNPDIHDE